MSTGIILMSDNSQDCEAPEGARNTTHDLTPPPLVAVARLLDALAKLCNWLASIIMIFVVVTFAWMVFSRYVLGHTPTWIGQLGLVLFIYIVCLGAAAGVRQGIHLSIDFVRESFPRPLRLVSHAISDLIMLVFGITMATQGWHLSFANANHTIALLGISASWRSAPLVLCGTLIVIFITYDIVERILKRTMLTHNGGSH